MDWKLALTTFGTLFLAEMGDKTQLAAFTLSGSSKKPWTVFVSASLALVCVTGIGVLVGGLIAEKIPESLLKKIVSGLFIGIGLWTWFKG